MVYQCSIKALVTGAKGWPCIRTDICSVLSSGGVHNSVSDCSGPIEFWTIVWKCSETTLCKSLGINSENISVFHSGNTLVFVFENTLVFNSENIWNFSLRYFEYLTH